MSRKIVLCFFVAALFTRTVSAQDKMADKHAALLNETLRQVIDAGARMFNDNGDHAGCYRLWQGSLMSIKPFVPPDMQASINKGLASAEKLDSYADKAFELRKVLDEIRVKTKGAVKSGAKDEVKGRVTYEGKPVVSGTLTLVSGKQKFSGAITDGTFSISSVPVGDYRVAIESAKAKILPARYSSADTSGLSIRVQAGSQTVTFELVK